MISVEIYVCFARKLRTGVAQIHVIFQDILKGSPKLPLSRAVSPLNFLLKIGTYGYMKKKKCLLNVTQLVGSTAGATLYCAQTLVLAACGAHRCIDK